jgi:hypothetical protein
MAKPPKKDTQVFNDSIDGVYGRFRTTDSYEVNYLLCCVNVQDLNKLSTASSTFEFSKIRFEDMMQRDVDYERVDEKIIQQYLEKGAGRVLFFPPIIVSVISLESDQVVKDTYDSVESSFNDETVKITFDKDKFCIELSTTDADTGHSIEIDNQTLHYNPAWTTFRYNKNKIRLIVIDGQHRFEALMRLVNKNKQLIQFVELPVCIVFTPAANLEGTDESIVKDLREMFVTINTTAKEVSGHFIDLLKDKSLASMAVRSLANLWKQSHSDPCYSMLQQLEWNERKDSRVNTVQRKYSITTVSIVAEALRAYAFSSARTGLQYQLLNLPQIETDLKTSENAIEAVSIAEDEFHASQELVLKIQIDNLITPALNTLFTEPRPYLEIRSSFLEAVKQVDAQVKQGKNKSAAFKEEVLSRFRRCTSKDPASIKNYEENEFDALINAREEDRVYFLNVFQQALIGVWAQVSAEMVKTFSISPRKTAEILVYALNVFAFDPNKKLFEKNMPYTNLLIFSGSKVILAQYARVAWKNLLQASLLQPDSRARLRTFLSEEFGENTDAVYSLFIEGAKQALKDYRDELFSRILTAVQKDWVNRPYPRGLIEKLESLSKENQEQFQLEIENLASNDHREALHKLGNRLDLNLNDSRWENV